MTVVSQVISDCRVLVAKHEMLQLSARSTTNCIRSACMCIYLSQKV